MINNRSILKQTAEHLVQRGKGILAADEDPNDFTKRFQTMGIENNVEQRRIYRQILFTTENIEKYLSGILMHEETFDQTTDSSQDFPLVLSQMGILPGIKLDRGLQSFTMQSNQTITLGFDDLDQRAEYFWKRGARFALWRCVFRFDEERKESSSAAISINLNQLARFASICQSKGLVPFVQIDWNSFQDDQIDVCQRLSEKLLTATFEMFRNYDIYLEGCVLKTKMMRTTKGRQSSIALATLTTLKRTCPSALAGIVFLSGGQSDDEALENLNAIRQKSDDEKCPWPMTFAFGRALHGSAMKIWMGKRDNEINAQQEFFQRLVTICTTSEKVFH